MAVEQVLDSGGLQYPGRTGESRRTSAYYLEPTREEASGPNYWWTGEEAVEGGTAPQEGWVPVYLENDLGPAVGQYTQWFDPSFRPADELVPGQKDIRSEYGISFGDPYAATAPGAEVPVTAPSDGTVTVPGGIGDELSNIEIGDDGKPVIPAERKYAALSGEEFFNELYNNPDYQAFLAPFMQNGETLEDLAIQYAGVPVVSGYWTQNANGEEVFIPDQSLYDTASTLQEMRNLDFPSFDEWLASTGQERPETMDLSASDPYQGIADIADQFGDTEGNRARIEEEEARAAGFLTEDGRGDVEAYNAWRTQNREQLDQGITGQEGLSEEQQWMMDRSLQSTIQTIVDSNQQMVESLGMQSSVAAYSKMGEISNQIANTSVQHGLKKMEADQLQRQMNYEALMGRYESITRTGAEAGMELADQIYEDRMGALTSYATQLDVLIEQNNEALQERALLNAEYNSTMSSIAAHADQMYRTVMTQIGYDEYLMAESEQKYNEFMAPYWTALEKWYQEAIVEQGDEALDVERELGRASERQTAATNRAANAGSILAAAGTGATIGSAFGPWGTIIGGLIGLAGGAVATNA